MQTDDVTLNINFVTGKARLEQSKVSDAVNLAVTNVAFRAAKNRMRKLKANVYRDFAPIVERELQDMARNVARMAIGISNPSNPPPGSLSISGRISRAMIGNSGPMNISSMTGQWAVRTETYMKSKFKKYRTRRWFYNTGALQKQLSSLGTYRSAYGPIRVRFVPTLSESDGRVSNLGRSRGGQSRNIVIGRLEVSPLRNLRLSDLPGIGEKATYNERLLSPLATSVRKKLTGKKDKYRPVIEPFLTYYMTRRIPNAVYRKLEDSI